MRSRERAIPGSSLLIEGMAVLLYSLYVYFVLERWQLSIVYGWMSEWLYWSVIFVFAFGYMRSGRWKGKII